MGATTNIGLLLITPGDPAYRNSWGTALNTDVFQLVDDYTAGQTSKAIGGTGDVVLAYTDGATCEARASHFIFTGILTGDRTVFWPVGHELNFSVSNQTTGAHTLTLAVGTGGSPAGATLTIGNGGSISTYRSDGTNILARGGTLGNSGVVAGTYDNATVTIAATGVITSASSGGRGVQVMAASTTFVTPSNTTTGTVFKFTLTGGGGSRDASNRPGAGAGTVVVWITGLSPSTNVAVTVGAGGSSGGAGGNSVVAVGGITATATGGAAGGSSQPNGSGGTVSGTANYVVYTGGAPAPGFASTANGGSSFVGGSMNNVSGTGTVGYGVGGAQGTGVGGAGLVTAEWW